MAGPYDQLDTRHISEGRAENVLHERAIYDTTRSSVPPSFYRYIVLEVISDPATLDKAKLSHYENDLGVANIQYASVAPRNTIIARKVLHAGSSAAEKVMVLYPFFPPHLAFPAKPGEHVWVMFENPQANEHALGYWMCRIVQPNFVEDVNYTHADRQFDYSFLPGLSDVFEGTDAAVYEFRNGAVDSQDGQRYAIVDTVSLPSGDNIETAYSDLMTNTDASKIINYESVPRYRKRPADVALEGSNNTLIVMGTDRTGAVSDYDDDPNLGKIPKPFDADIQGGLAGSIDIVSGRGQTTDTGGTPVQNQPLNNSELGKDGKTIQANEGDVDLVNDRSRVLVSQKTKPDTNFQLSPVVSKHGSASAPSDDDGYGAIVIKTDKIRLIARQDVVIMVVSADATQPPAKDGNNIKDPATGGTALDPDQCASIIVRSNGDIVFTPAKTGVIKLGGDDAGLAVLCTDQGGASNGQVSASPIIDTMGGGQGGSGGLNGTFATKVLLK
jgi:hypothetical protein